MEWCFIVFMDGRRRMRPAKILLFPWAIDDYLEVRAHSHDRLTIAQTALEAARKVGRRYDEAEWLDKLGTTLSKLARYDEAIEDYRQARVLRRQIGDRSGEAISLSHLGEGYLFLDRPRVAINYLLQALELSMPAPG